MEKGREKQDGSLKKEVELRSFAMFTIDQVAFAVFWLTYDGVFKYVNDAACNMLGYTREELLTMTIGDIASTVRTQYWGKHWEELRQSGKLFFESEHKIKSGKLIPVEVESTYMKFGGKEYICVFARDISVRKNAEDELKASEHKFRHLFDVSPDALFLINEKGKFVSANEVAINLYGYTLFEFQNMTPVDIAAPDLKENSVQNVNASLKKENSFEWRHCTKEGREFDVSINTKPIEIDGFSFVFAVVRDISKSKKAEDDLRKSEDKFHKAFFSHPGIVGLSTLKEGRYIDVNNNFCKLLGWSREEVIGKTSKKLDIFDDYTEREKLLSLLKKDGFIQDLELRIKTKDGDRRIISFSAEVIEVDEKKCLLAQVFDITEHKNADNKLLESEARLRELNATKDKFFNIIAHDLRNPVQTILGFSSILEEQMQKKDYEGIEEFSGYIHSASKHLADFITNLLEWSRSQTGKITFKPENVDLLDTVNEVLEVVNDFAKQKSISIDNLITNNVSAIADKAMLQNIFRNLISNSIKFSNPDENVIISAEDKQNEILIAVKDSGVGMTKEHIDKLFSLSVNCSTLGTENEKGTGLGLLLCKDFVDKHGGKIWVESEAGVGSTFYFTLPKN